jgi:hypothetical protein
MGVCTAGSSVSLEEPTVRIVPHVVPLALLAHLVASPAHAACPPAGQDAASLRALKANGFAVPAAGGQEGDARRQTLALALVDCLGAADPELRDGIAYEALSTWGRAGALTPMTLRALLNRLVPEIAPGRSDAAGFRQPFAALVLAEVARADRLVPFLQPEERGALVRAGADYLASVRDYRGFEPRAGWRHGVAHGADLLMQLALNPALSREELDVMLEALAAQVVPKGEHAYVFGEPERLARPVLFAARRGLHPPEAWTAWFARAAAVPEGKDAFRSRAGLAHRHNAQAFLLAVYVALQEGEDAALRERLLPGVRAALRAVP